MLMFRKTFYYNHHTMVTFGILKLRRQLDEKEYLYAHETEGCTWHPEFGGWMIESTPSRPYSKYASDLLRVERNMILRRRRLLSLLKPNEIAPYVRRFQSPQHRVFTNYTTFQSVFAHR